MKKGMKRTISLIVTLIIVLLPFFTNENLAMAKDKHDNYNDYGKYEKYQKYEKYKKYFPLLSTNLKTLDYSKETFELSLTNSDYVDDITWYSEDKNVAKIVGDDDEETVTITAVSKGTTWIRCKIELENDWSYYLSCRVVVKSLDVQNPELSNVTQAKLISVVRKDNYTLVATFDKAIEIPGLVLINNKTVCIEGVVDNKDATKVYYSIPSEASGLTGKQKVYIGYYSRLGVVASKNTISKLTEVTVDFTLNYTTALPAPAAIIQDPNNNNVISIIFNQNLDKATAETVSNYIIDKVNILSAELTNSTSGAIVKLKIKEGSITLSKDYSVLIYGIKGVNNSYTTMNVYQSSIYLKENVAPIVKNFSYVYPNTVTIQFDEKIMGTANFRVLQNNKDVLSYNFINGDTLNLVLISTPESNNYLEVIPSQDNKIADLFGNTTTSILSKYILPINK